MRFKPTNWVEKYKSVILNNNYCFVFVFITTAIIIFFLSIKLRIIFYKYCNLFRRPLTRI